MCAIKMAQKGIDVTIDFQGTGGDWNTYQPDINNTVNLNFMLNLYQIGKLKIGSLSATITVICNKTLISSIIWFGFTVNLVMEDLHL